MKQAIIIGFLGQTQDRFSAYQSPADTRQKLELAAQVPFPGIEMVYPYETGEAAQTAAMMKELGLEFAAINCNIKKETELVPGALSRPIKEIREMAVQFIKGAKDYAAAVGAPLVTVCPLSDGYDHLFQVDYRQAWRFMIETFGEAADYRPEIPLFVEPKFNETRVHCHIDNTSTALLLLKEIGNANTGVTLDFGHAMYAGENPARSLITIAETGFKYYLHINDNDARHDWDLACGSRNFLHFAEFLFWAKELKYDRYLTTDASPRIFDRVRYFAHHTSMADAIWKLIDELDNKEFLKLMAEEKSIELFDLVKEKIYRL